MELEDHVQPVRVGHLHRVVHAGSVRSTVALPTEPPRLRETNAHGVDVPARHEVEIGVVKMIFAIATDKVVLSPEQIAPSDGVKVVGAAILQDLVSLHDERGEQPRRSVTYRRHQVQRACTPRRPRRPHRPLD